MNFIMMQQKSDHHLVDPSKNNIYTSKCCAYKNDIPTLICTPTNHLGRVWLLSFTKLWYTSTC